MTEAAISIQNVGKTYQIRHADGRSVSGHDTLRDVMADVGRRILNAVIPGKAIGLMDRDSWEDFHALQDVSFDVAPGEVVGMIGRNGAGKSTLLKILSRITEPSRGRIELNGRVASLLEVGTGFHPELTGRENIYLNGAILGMSRHEISRKFDEIVEFSGVQRFLDTPVKRYSSGMYVRLAFSVAAHLEPEILLIDEVLAVGDNAFQKKCLGKMNDVAGQEGRTIIFVSHNMAAVQRLCNRVVYLRDGEVDYVGEVEEAVRRYLAVTVGGDGQGHDLISTRKNPVPPVAIRRCLVLGDEGRLADGLRFCEPFSVYVELEARESYSQMNLTIGIETAHQLRISTSRCTEAGIDIRMQAGERQAFLITFDGLTLTPGSYGVSAILRAGTQIMDRLPNAAGIEVTELAFHEDVTPNRLPGLVRVPVQWERTEANIEFTTAAEELTGI